ncbi:beta-lactamase family protein [Saprospiraceae bacterium]|nr:beta-lactamase family protein [Saprospiraceae bacterium]
MKCNILLKVLFVLSFTFFLGTITAQDTNLEVTQAIQKRFEKLLKKKKVVGASVAIVDNGKVVFADGFGFEDREKGIRASAQTMFRIGSITKNFTALAVMQLQEKGLLNIEESIKVYLPELTMESGFGDEKILTIKSIMAHISGLPSDILNGMMSSEPPSIEWAIQNLNQFVSSSPDNYAMSYSNVGYGLLGELISRVSGMTYGDYLTRNIFEPLEMNNSFCGINPKKLAKAYFDKEVFAPELIRDYAAGSIASSAQEMANYLLMQLNDGMYNEKEVISQASLAMMNENHVGNTHIPATQSYGFAIDISGLDVTSADEEKTRATLYNHGGDTYAFHANFGYIPELNVGAVILTNSENGGKIRSISQLLDFYLEETRGINVSINDNKESESINSDLLETADVKGIYSAGPLLMDVQDIEKFTFKQSGQKVVLKRKKGTNKYGISIRLLGFIPIKIKAAELEFLKRDNEVFLVQNSLDDGSTMYFAKKEQRQDDYGTWNAKFGNYEVINACKSNVPFFDFEDAKVELKNNNGLMTLILESMNETQEYIFNVHNNKIALTQGIGRHAGTNLVILDNGNLLFSGFELKMK